MEKENTEKLFSLFFGCIHMMHRARPDTRPEGKDGFWAVHRGQGKLLIELFKTDGLTNGEIAEIMDIRPSSVNDLVTKLEAAGFVEKREGEENKRQARYFLTDKGRKFVEKFEKSDRFKEITNMFSCLTDEEQETLRELLSKLYDDLKSKYGNRPDHDHPDFDRMGADGMPVDDMHGGRFHGEFKGHGHGPHGGRRGQMHFSFDARFGGKGGRDKGENYGADTKETRKESKDTKNSNDAKNDKKGDGDN